MVSGHLSLDNFPPGQLPPWNPLPRQLSPGLFPPDNYPWIISPEQLPPRELPPMKSPLDFCSWIFSTWDNYPRTVDPHEILPRAVDPWTFASEHSFLSNSSLNNRKKYCLHTPIEKFLKNFEKKIIRKGLCMLLRGDILLRGNPFYRWMELGFILI